MERVSDHETIAKIAGWEGTCLLDILHLIANLTSIQSQSMQILSYCGFIDVLMHKSHFEDSS